MLNQVMDALRDPNLHTIGVFGMGGIGKTTLAKEVQGKALQEKLFETVVLVAVSQAPEIGKIQQEIADFLGLDFSAKEISGRASQLYKSLENSKVLIILDDLWQKLDLSSVGIPSHGASEGCKVMLTSRSRDLLSSEMRAQKLFSVRTLEEKETLCLFQMLIAEATDPEFHNIAIQIAKICAGLPLLIQIVATKLTNKELYVWRNMLNQLSEGGDEEIYQKVHRLLESSYENLPEQEMKQFFLLCALFGQSNIQIRYLLTHSMGLGLFKHIHKVEAARDKLFTVIGELKAQSLLLDGDMAGYVKLHDVVRDTALSIASRVQHAFIGKHEEGFRDLPKKECRRISLPFCNVSEFPRSLDCAEAEVFFLFTEDLSLEIPDRFFDGLRKLKVVDLRGMRLVSFPSSFALLADLQTFCLHNCRRLDNLAVLGELRQLEYLSFANSNIVELPRETKALTRLKVLDLQGCSDLRVIQENLFSKLSSLEELYMLNSFVRWNAKGNVSLKELENLDRLSTLEIQIPDPKMIPEGFNCFSHLKRYKISIGHIWDCHWKEESEGSRMLKLEVEAGVHLEYGTEFLLRGAEYLFLYGVKGIDILFYQGFPKLKHMDVGNDYDIQHLIQTTMAASHSPFPFLESLYLRYLPRLETICSQLTMETFKELRILKISDCDKLSSLFSFSSLKCLQQLRELEVVSCRDMEAVVGERNEDEEIELTQLSSLMLAYLPHLTGFCKTKEGNEQIGMLFNSEMVSFPNLTTLEVRECESLKRIFSVSTVKCLMQLKNLKIDDCELVEEIIHSKKLEEIEEDSTEAIVFPKLDCLLLWRLEKVKRFGCRCTIEFPSLRELDIRFCSEMRSFVARNLSSGTTENFFNEMVTFSNLERMRIYYMDSIKYLWDEKFIADDSFFELKSISLHSCSKLEVVFPSETCTRFQRVDTLSLSDCGGVQEIYQSIDLGKVNEPFSLRELQIDNLGSMRHIWNEESEWNKGSFSTFQNLQSVEVKSCEDLKWVFPASVGCGLPQIQRLKIKNCGRLEVMIAKAKDDEGAIKASFQFPELKELEFEDLKEMSSLFEAGPHTMECPNLTSLTLLQCSNISLGKVIANVEQLIVDEQGLHAIHGSADVSGGFYYKLKKVILRSVNEETSAANLFSFLGELKVLEMLVLERCSLEEIFKSHDRRPTGDEIHHCLGVKHLQLRSIRQLNYITKKDSQFNRILQTLHLDRCDDLVGITASSIFLQNLTTLHVVSCHNMKNLVTASTAKTMVHLIEMKVEFCDSIEEIVAKDGGDTEHDVTIMFNKLQRLDLTHLRDLKSFCSDKYTFSFPLLDQVIISQCPKMKSFGCGAVCTPKLRGILFEDEQQWEGNLNATIASQLEIWVGEHLEHGRRFQNLESLEVVKSTNASTSVLLANQMHFLNKLRKIKVIDCDSIQVVFDLEGLSAEEGCIELLPELNKVELVNLPLLTHLCNKSPNGILEFNNLQVLKIDNCSRLKYALTWSMASCLPQLQTVEVKNCEMMETLIEDEKDVAAKVTFREFKSVVLEFPSVREVTIRECPAIKALLISTQVHSINQAFPKLEKLSIDMKSVEGMMQYQAATDLFSGVKILELTRCSAKAPSHVLLVRFLSRFPNLDELELCGSSFQELLNNEIDEAPTIPHIKIVRLNGLFDVNKMWWRASQFHSLETLQVFECNQLMNLMTPSMAKSMVQLKLLTIEGCKMLMEVVGDESDRATDEIIFPKLEGLELYGLQSLKAFSLTHYNFNFPCLDRVVLGRCPNLRIFCNGIVTTEILNRVFHSGTSCWEGNLNTTTEHLYRQMDVEETAAIRSES